MGQGSVMSKRGKFSEEFKREVVELTRQLGTTVSQVARDIGDPAATGQSGSEVHSLNSTVRGNGVEPPLSTSDGARSS